MNVRVVMVVGLLGGLAAACTKTDNKTANVWGVRPLQARLTGFPQWQGCQRIPGEVVDRAQCGPVRTLERRDCDREVVSRAEAVSMLAETSCTDEAITALERFARQDNLALSDLGAAYYTRAQRDAARGSDLLASLQASEAALAIMPDLPSARFNRALALEALGFTDDAVAAWGTIERLDAAPWRREAHEHRERLVRTDVFDGATEWAKAEAQLPDAQSVEQIAKLIRPFPSRGEKRLLDHLLPAWAATPTPERLTIAQNLATALTQVTGDRFPLDVVAASQPSEDVLQGIQLFHEARTQNFEWAAKEHLYATAMQRLGKHPLRLFAAAEHAIAVSFRPNTGPTEALALLEPLRREVEARHYTYLLARVQAAQGYCLHNASQYVRAITAYGEALAEYRRIGDSENVARIQTRLAGCFTTAGQKELAWNQVLGPVRMQDRLVDPGTRTVAIGEASDAAAALGYTRIALAYQMRNVAQLEKSPDTKQALAVALRKRALLELALDQDDAARADLDRVRTLTNETAADVNNRRALQSRFLELQGRAESQTDPRLAIRHFTEALGLAGADDLNTFRAALYAQRAGAYRQLQQHKEADSDLFAALHELREEQRKILAARERGEAEELWSAYFSRFQETYELLIRQLTGERRYAEAFAQAEKARGFEPLDLLLQRKNVPAAFRTLTRDGESLELPAIQAELPENAFLLEYTVFRNDTFVWIVSRDHPIEFRVLRASRATVERWSTGLQQTALHHQKERFETILQASYDALLREPLNVVNTLSEGAPVRLIIVPDGAMHGLPFAGLRDSDTKRFLIEQAPIEIAPSATLYVHSLVSDRKWRQNGEPSVLLIGDPAFNENLPLVIGMGRLQGARGEVRDIAMVYPKRSTVREDAQATVPEFLRLARNSTIVHFAGHAVANRNAPERSFLLLAPSTGHSGVLDAQELLTELSLDRTRLVVLSACSSAGGSAVGPEGVSPLVRPLITAGAPAVIGSLWDVEDATAAEVLVSFHRHYEQGEDAAIAMQHAQLALLRKKQPYFRSVLAWAPFQVIGHASSPFAPAPTLKETHLEHVPRTHPLQRSDGVRPQ
jgi:CHAT domain-containing protein